MTDAFTAFEDKICDQEKVVRRETEKLLALHRERPAKRVTGEYRFAHPGGTKTLADLFNGKDHLILIHNMGKSCAWCALWADGFTGFKDYFETRAGFALVNNDPVEEQQAFAKARGWNYPVYSVRDTPFSGDMGFAGPKEKPGFWPGISIFRKTPSGEIEHLTRAGFGPGDLFCEVYNVLGMFIDNPDDNWSPKERKLPLSQ